MFESQGGKMPTNSKSKVWKVPKLNTSSFTEAHGHPRVHGGPHTLKNGVAAGGSTVDTYVTLA
jgi:hypothetical protein